MQRLRPSSPAIATGVGVALLTAGLGLWLLTPDQAADHGWFAYAPLAEEPLTPPTIWAASAGRYWGIGLAALGAVLVSGVIGYRIGRSQGRAGTGEGPGGTGEAPGGGPGPGSA